MMKKTAGNLNDAPVTRDTGSIRAELQRAFEKILS